MKQFDQKALLLFLLIASWIAWIPILSAQTTQGSIVGIVADSSGSIIPGASVTLINMGTSERRTAVTSDAGAYSFRNLIPGSYRIEAELSGFKRFVREPIVVEVENVVQINIAMQIGDISETVEVTSQTPLLQTQATSLSQVVEGRTVEEMPLNGRNVLNLVALVSGVVPQGGAMGTTATANNFAWGNYAIGGGIANQAATYIDGGPVNVNYNNLTALVPTQDAVSEFRVQTNNLSAEYGRFSGGVINVSTKSGTNEFHGSVYEYLRNRVLNANTFFSNKAGLDRPAFTQNQFGANLTGPAIKDKMFFLFSYEGLRLRQGNTYTYTVPTPEMYDGDFSRAKNSNGSLAVIYDPLTTCGVLGNPACGSGQTVLRQTFANNKIPANRIDKTAQSLAKRVYGLPNTAGNAVNGTANFVTNAAGGGDNDQYNTRIDLNISSRQHLFGRYTRWNQRNIGIDPYNNDTYASAVSDESNITDQAVIDDTYTFSPSLLGDFRFAGLRYAYDRTVPGMPYDLTQFGFPKSLNDSIDPQFRTLPLFRVAGMDSLDQVPIMARNYSYSFAPNMTKIKGRHTLKFGAEVRRLEFNFFQVNAGGGNYQFTNLFTAANPQSPNVGGVSTGFAMASAILGYGSTGNLNTFMTTSGVMLYQGYYINDTFQATRKLTLNLGIRWEIPSPWTEKHDRLVVFQPDKPNPVVPAYKGMIALVNTPDYPDRHSYSQHLDLFAPRFGASYQVMNNLVVRGGYGIFFVPSDNQHTSSPYNHPINIYNNPWAPTLDSSLTPNDVISNPFPSGIRQPPSRDPIYQQLVLGGGNVGSIPGEPYGYNQQWNFNVQYQFGQGTVVEAGYAGSRGVHLPRGQALNQLPEQYMSLGGTALNRQVPNPFYGKVLTGTLAAKTVAAGQLLRPYPQYGNISNGFGGNGFASYNALNTRIQKRFQQGGLLTGSYTFAKNIGIVETSTPWMEGGQSAGIQNEYNLRGERAVSSFDVTHRFVASYVLDLPMGKGRKLFGNATGFLDKVVSGWGINGIVNFQSGFPLHMTMQNNLTNAFQSGSRPNVVAGCDPNIEGPAQDKYNKWFNTSCYSTPAASTWGNAPRNEARLRAAGVNNWDLSITKNTVITENVGLQFRAELFNLFNRVQFGPPNQALGNVLYGAVTAQRNLPRVAQFALRLVF